METRIKHCSLLRRLGEEAKYKKLKCYVLHASALRMKYLAAIHGHSRARKCCSIVVLGVLGKLKVTLSC